MPTKSMEVAGHFIFELFKIAVLASVYALLTLLLAKILARIAAKSKYHFHIRSGWNFWMKSGAMISVLLFCWMCSYWGSHGLGDSARIPIGNSRVVEQINANSTYIERVSGEQYGIGDFSFNDNFLFAEYAHGPEADAQDYLIWDLRNDNILAVREETYISGIKKFGFPAPSTFLDFDEHYSRYWSGWRFWLLP